MLKKSGICALLLSAALAVFQPVPAAAQQRYNSSQQYNQKFVSPRNDRNTRNEGRDRRYENERYENERRDFRGGNEWGNNRSYGQSTRWNGSSRTYFTPNYYGAGRNRFRAPQCDRY